MASIEELKSRSLWLRQELFELVMRFKKGHIPSCFSCAEMVLALFYGGYLKLDPKNPRSRDRDKIIISKGHAAMVLYPILSDLGFFPKEELLKFTQPEGILHMYADHSIPGIESITGSLGHGIGIGCGFAYCAKRDNQPYRSFVVISDGECYEGSVWETALFAAHYRLDNFVVIVDRNGLCILDSTEKCVRLEPLEEKWKSFGWHVLTVNGHSYSEILRALDEATTNKTGKPVTIISKSVKGKGISFMENRPEWHNQMPNEEELSRARKELQVNCIVN